MKSLKYEKHNRSVWYLFRNLRNKISLKLPTRCYRVNAGDFWLWIDTRFLLVYTATSVHSICIGVEIINDHPWFIEDLLICWIIHLKCSNYQIDKNSFKILMVLLFFSEEKQFVWKIRALHRIYTVNLGAQCTDKKPRKRITSVQTNRQIVVLSLW